MKTEPTGNPFLYPFSVNGVMHTPEGVFISQDLVADILAKYRLPWTQQFEEAHGEGRTPKGEILLKIVTSHQDLADEVSKLQPVPSGEIEALRKRLMDEAMNDKDELRKMEIRIDFELANRRLEAAGLPRLDRKGI